MERISEMPRDFESVKSRLLNEFPGERIEGLNKDRVIDFIKSKGLQTKPFIVFDKEELPKVQKIAGSTDLLGSTFNSPKGQAFYSGELDIILLARDKEVEKSSGPIYTEGILAHELAHASNTYQGYAKDNNGTFYTPRIGFCLLGYQSNGGWFLEEGWADMNRANYVEKYATEEEKDKIVQALRYEDLNMNDTIPLQIPSKRILPLPLKYFYVNPEGIAATMATATAGYSLELLCKYNPNLFSIIVESRKSVEGLRKFAVELNNINPGLYKELRECNYSEKKFSEKLSYILSNISGGTKNVIHAEGELKDTWNTLLPDHAPL